MGTGDFTVEMWLYGDTFSTATVKRVFGQTDSSATAASTSLDMFVQSGVLYAYAYSGTTGYNAYGDIPNSQWTHVAFVRDGATLRLYINGSQARTASISTNSVNDSSNDFCVGRSGELTSNTYAGYISNFRLVKGTCVYTGGTTFIPSTTPLTAITNTSLLTCQSNRFVDNSSNAFAITANGDVSVQAFSPFNPTASWSAATYGGSGYFDGSGDYLTAPSSSSLALGTGDFTVECWSYVTAGDNQLFYDFRTSTGSSNGFNFGRSDANGFYVYNNIEGVIAQSGSGTATKSAWMHVAVTRSGTTLRLFVNGAVVATATNSTNYSSTAVPGIGGSSATFGAGQNLLNGYLCDLRIVKGTAVYTAAFTPPNTPLTAISNTQLLTSFTNAGIYDATSKNDLETVGNAQISTTQSKFGGSSMYFDGTGDGLVGRSTQLASFGTGDFTVEGWVYLTSITGADRYLFTTGNGIDNSLRLYLDSTGKVAVFTSFTLVLTSTNPLVVNTWTHVAVCRYNGTLAVYINGVQNGTASYSTAINCNGNISVGSDNNGGSSMIGYLDDMRVTKGIARYTSNFTPPTTAFLTL
jgi:hypothetical protein